MPVYCTVTVAPLLATTPHAFVTHTQYDVVEDGATVSDAELPPMGVDALPEGPTYH